jgi:hypothetical protein
MNNTTIALSPKDELINNVKRWVMIDKQLKIVNEKTRELRQMKQTCGDGICSYLSENPNLNNVIGITGGELRIYQKKDYSPLTFGYIEKCLGELIPNKPQVDYIIKYLKEHREITTTDDIKYKAI